MHAKVMEGVVRMDRDGSTPEEFLDLLQTGDHVHFATCVYQYSREDNVVWCFHGSFMDGSGHQRCFPLEIEAVAKEFRDRIARKPAIPAEAEPPQDPMAIRAYDWLERPMDFFPQKDGRVLSFEGAPRYWPYGERWLLCDPFWMTSGEQIETFLSYPKIVGKECVFGPISATRPHDDDSADWWARRTASLKVSDVEKIFATFCRMYVAPLSGPTNDHFHIWRLGVEGPLRISAGSVITRFLQHDSQWWDDYFAIHGPQDALSLVESFADDSVVRSAMDRYAFYEDFAIDIRFTMSASLRTVLPRLAEIAQGRQH